MFYLEAFATHPIYRGKSLGKLLLSFVEDKARAQNIDWLRLDCWSGNPRLRSYYLKQGYTEFGQCQLGSWQGILFEKCLIVSSDSV